MSLNKKRVLILLTILAVAFGFVFFQEKDLFQQDDRVGFILSDRQVEEYADGILEICEDENYKPKCYEEEIPKLMDKISLEDAFKITRVVQEKDPSFAYCHVLAHNLSYEESERRPTHWKDILPRCPITMCNYGCLHGSLIQHYKGEVLTESQIDEAVKDMKEVCEPREGWNPAEIDRTMCYHALGHLAMYITGGNPDRSNDVCMKVSVKEDGRNYYEVCVEGVFMTVYQGVDEEDIALVRDIKPEKDEVRDFCNKYEGVEYEACNRESYPLFREDLEDPKYLSGFCSYSRTEHGKWKCYAVSVGDIVVGKLERGEIFDMVDYCLNLKERNEQCFANVATRMIQIETKYSDKAIDICHKASEYDLGEECFRDVANYSGFAFKDESKEKSSFCNKLQGEWKEVCLKDEDF